jgi:hypothetical protein
MSTNLRETLLLAVGAATALKLLLLAPGAYHSTDFEVGLLHLIYFDAGCTMQSVQCKQFKDPLCTHTLHTTGAS